MNRVVALLVAGSLVAPPFLEARHAGQVRHVACPVDGQFEDARDESPGVPHSHSAETVLPSGDASPHGHGRCDATPATRQRAVTVQSSAARLPVLAREVPPVLTAELRPSAVELYRLAPKLSPPL